MTEYIVLDVNYERHYISIFYFACWRKKVVVRGVFGVGRAFATSFGLFKQYT